MQSSSRTPSVGLPLQHWGKARKLSQLGLAHKERRSATTSELVSTHAVEVIDDPLRDPTDAIFGLAVRSLDRASEKRHDDRA